MTAAGLVPAVVLRRLFDRAVEVADPMQSLAAHLPPKPQGRVVVIGAGKASARMAEAVEAAWGPCEGLVITRYGYGRPCSGIQIIEAAHPIPDQAGVDATSAMLGLVAGLGPDDFVLALISGGASALLCAPISGVSLADKQAVNAALLASGATIGQMNSVRKRLSRIKAGQLAAAVFPARLLTLMISDVPGDDPAMIGSGPTVGDDAPIGLAAQILSDYQIAVPPAVAAVLAGPSGAVATNDPRLSHTENRIYAAPSQSIEAARTLAESLGFRVVVMGDAIEGEARDIARDHADLARQTAAGLRPGDAPVILLSGGELTVTRRGTGVGGPNAEYCLALAIALDGAPGIHALACDSDGVDGAAEVAGAIIGPDTLDRAKQKSRDAQTDLAANDSHSFFAAIQSQVITGPTLTNVNDFRAILCLP